MKFEWETVLTHVFFQTCFGHGQDHGDCLQLFWEQLRVFKYMERGWIAGGTNYCNVFSFFFCQVAQTRTTYYSFWSIAFARCSLSLLAIFGVWLLFESCLGSHRRCTTSRTALVQDADSLAVQRWAASVVYGWVRWVEGSFSKASRCEVSWGLQICLKKLDFVGSHGYGFRLTIERWSGPKSGCSFTTWSTMGIWSQVNFAG